MGHLRRAALAAVTAIALLGFLAAPANASPGARDDTQALVQRADRALAQEPGGSLPPGASVQIRGATGSVTSAQGTATLAAADQANSVARAQPDGVQVLTVLRQGSTARYRLSLPAGQVARPGGSGGLLITDVSGRVFYGAVRAPWAVDATGRQLGTTYSLEGGTIVQHVDTRGAVYPIVADPWVSFGWFVYVNYSRSEVQTLAAYADYYALASAACSLIPVPWVRLACTATIGAIAISFARTVREAAWYGQCVNIRFTYAGTLAGWGRYYC